MVAAGVATDDVVVGGVVLLVAGVVPVDGAAGRR